MTSSNHFARPRIILARGPRAGEQALLDSIEHSLEVLGQQVLTRPIHLLVPSHSLRNHLLDRLVRSRQRSVAGVTCWTLRGLAREILERAGEKPPVGGHLLPILVRRAARREHALRECLEHLRDGYGSLVGTVTDLLEAGLDPAHGEAIEESLAAEGRSVATAAEIRRARSLVRVANHVQEELEAFDLGAVSALLKRATEVLDTHPHPLLPCSGLHVYGFADATGLATDLVLASVKRYSGIVYLDNPPDPADWQQDEPTVEFGRRFNERLLDLGKAESVSEDTSRPPAISLVSALGTQAEVREIGWRIRSLLDNGARPEGIAVVARQPGPYRSALRTHFRRLAIPFSAVGSPGPQLPMGRQIQALLELLERRGQARLDRWLDARAIGSESTPLFDLRLALFGLGAGRLDELVDLPFDRAFKRDTYPLPVRVGFTTTEESGVHLHRRHVPTKALRQAKKEAAELCDLFDRWTRARHWTAHLEQFDRLSSLLGWSADQTMVRDIRHALDRLGNGVTDAFELDLDEWSSLVTGALESIGLERLGGRGGGVQILDVIEARGRTFEHLFLLGMNKGIFPRTVREDPALPDSLRQVLGREGHGVLPDLPRKLAGYAEERFLFAQLCSASPNVTLSWQVATDDNQEATPSPLVERLLWSSPAKRVRSPQSIAPSAEAQAAPRTEFENGIRAALWGSRRNLEANLTAAVPGDQKSTARALSRARLGIVDELNQPSGPESQLGPYFGFIGPAVDPADPRLSQPLYVTTLERFATCPWQTFLERVLRLETLPDPVDILPGLEPFAIGQLVHRVLEQLVAQGFDQNPSSLEEARSHDARSAPWPVEEELKRTVDRQADLVARDQGIVWDGYSAILGAVVMPFLEQARELIWSSPEGGRPVAVEMDCGVAVGQGEVVETLRFKADRVDSIAGRLMLTDYKTSRHGVSRSKTQKTRDRHLLAEIGKGRLLQAAAYAKAAGHPEDSGRYVFLRPDFTGTQESRIVSLQNSDVEIQHAFETAVSTLLGSWHGGTFFPRLVEPDRDSEPRACQYCAVAEACLRGDSGTRGRLRDWSEADREHTLTEQALLEAWSLGSKRGSTS